MTHHATDSSVAGPGELSRLTIACCVENGQLEEGVIRLVESLRANGGRYADATVVAVNPRVGPPLAATTLARFAELGVVYRSLFPRNRFAWLGYFNKYFALKEAEKLAGDGLVAFFDSDMIVLGEPTELSLPEGVDMGCVARDKNIGTTGPGDPDHKYWISMCGILGLDIDDVPMVTTEVEGVDIRLYWNSGVFVYRPETRLADLWRAAMEKVLDETPAKYANKAFWVDQVVLSLVVVKEGLSFLNLPGSLNYGIASHFKDHLTPEDLASAQILHYHDAMKPSQWAWFLEQLREPQPEVYRWLAGRGPVVLTPRPHESASKQALRLERSARRRVWKLRRPSP